MGAGLASTASSPSRRAASRAASAAWAVRTTAGSPGSTRRISWTSEAPPMPGMRMSVTTASKRLRETFSIAASRKDLYIQRYGRPGAEKGWHFLTGKPEAIAALTQAVGFRYVYDKQKDEYAHASGVVIFTPEGKAARYLYGIEFSPRDMRLALIEAGNNTIGNPIDQILLYCYHYDPLTGKYGVLIMNVIRLAGSATVLGLGVFMAIMFRRDRRHAAVPGEDH